MNPSLQGRAQVVSLLDEGYACRSSNLTLSVELAQKALSISRELGDKALIAKSLSQHALFSMIQGEYDAAISMSKEALAYFEELKDELGVASAKYNLGGVYYKTDNYYLGMAYLTDCVNIYRKNNDHQNLLSSMVCVIVANSKQHSPECSGDAPNVDGRNPVAGLDLLVLKEKLLEPEKEGDKNYEVGSKK